MNTRQVDVAVIGAGSAGMSAFRAASKHTDNVVLIEGGEFGTTCARVGCMPSKLLIAAAEAAHAVAEGPHFGVFSENTTIDGAAVMDRVRSERERSVKVGYVLAATGRAPNVDDLGLEQTSLVLDARGVPVFDPHTTQIGDSHVFLAGDVNNHRPLLHEASDEGRIAGDNAGRFPHVLSGTRRSPLAIVFTDPQIAMVGDSFRDLSGQDIAIGSVCFEDQGRSRVMRRNKGLLRVYADPDTRRFLGAEMIAPGAEHLGHLLAWAHQGGFTIDKMLDMPFYHPVVEEGLRTALRDARAELRKRPQFARAA